MRRLLLVLGPLMAPAAAASTIAPAPLAAQVSPAPASPAPLPSVTLPPELDRVLRDYERAWRASDAAGLADLFAEDGFVLANGKPPVRGRAAVRTAYTGQGGPLGLRAMAYAVGDTAGYIIGAFAADSGAPDMGKFILALKRPGGRGRWLIAADIDNMSQSPRRMPGGPGGGAQPAGQPAGQQPQQPVQRPPEH